MHEKCYAFFHFAKADDPSNTVALLKYRLQAGAKLLEGIGGATAPYDQKRRFCQAIFLAPRTLVELSLRVSFI